MQYTHEHTAVGSSSIEKVYYDTESNDLAIVFRNGNKAGYKNVPAYVYSNLATATSPGSYYNSNVRGYFSGLRIDSIEKRQGLKMYTEVPNENATKKKFKVVAEITGGVTLEVPADDLADALKVAEEQISKAFKGDVKISFKGVNEV